MSCDSEVDVKSKGEDGFALGVCRGRCLERAARRFINRFDADRILKLCVKIIKSHCQVYLYYF